MAAIHPFDPITPGEIGSVVHILRSKYPDDQLRFKLVDIFDCPKAEVISFLEKQRLGQTVSKLPDRRARVYFHLKKDLTLLHKAVVNITSEQVEKDESLRDVQGPVDFDEWTQIEEACNTHPKVIEQIQLLGLPKG
jgi:primary-amine oxidase